jgi:hypothetical protein
VYSNRPARWAPTAGGLTRGPRAAIDIWWLLGLVFVTFSLQFFRFAEPFFVLFRLNAGVWQRGFVWQLVTYGFVGSGKPDVWILLQLFILYLFAKDVFSMVGRWTFWRLLVIGTFVAGTVAVLVELGMRAVDLFPERFPFLLIQGQPILLVVLVAAFAALRRDAVIYLMFVLPVQARWFVGIEILLGFLGFLWSKDLAGFLGLTAAAGVSWLLFSGSTWRRLPRESWLRLQRLGYQLRLGWTKRRRGLRVVPGGRGRAGNGHADPGKVHRGPWVH